MRKFFILSITISILAACNDDDNSAPQSSSVNDFVWKGLNSWYYWKPNVPNLQDNRFADDAQYNSFINNTSTENLFYNLLYDYPNTDRFSWIVDDVDALLQQFSGIETSTGMDFSLAYLNQSQGTLVGMVNYVVPNSPAAEQGVMRGDVFYKINGSLLNTGNYRAIYDNQFTLSFAQSTIVNDEGIEFVGEQIVSLQARQIEENPVHHAQVFQVNGQNVGYLVYNGFKAIYNDELNDAIMDLAAQNVSELILDLRYNRGGSLTSALALGQMITGQFTGNEYVTLDFNDEHNGLDTTYELESGMRIYDFLNGQTTDVGSENINSLELNRLYVLTSGNSASASELTISCLRPYIDVILIGSKTYGKFHGSRTLFDAPDSDYMDYDTRNSTHNYAMQPICFAYYNAQEQVFPQGIPVNYEISFSQYLGNLGAFGDAANDAALAQALSLIGGNSARIAPKQFLEMKKFITEKEMNEASRELYLLP